MEDGSKLQSSNTGIEYTLKVKRMESIVIR